MAMLCIYRKSLIGYQQNYVKFIIISRQIVMQTKQQKQKIRTLCTIDTSDIQLQDMKQRTSLAQAPSNQDKQKRVDSLGIRKNNKSIQNVKPETPGQGRNRYFISTNAKQTDKPPLQQKNKNHSKSVLNKTMEKSKSRIKTQYSTSNQIVFKSILNKSSKSLKSKITNSFQQTYNMETYQMLQELASDQKKERKYLVRKKDKFYIMKRTKDPHLKSLYQRQLLIRQKITLEKNKNIQRLIKMYTQKNYIYGIYELYGGNFSWDNVLHVQVIKKILKNEGVLLKHIVKEIARAINELSSKGFAHTRIEITNLLLKIEQSKTSMKIQGNVKLSNLRHCINLKDKSCLLSLRNSIYTPPQIINLKLFQKSEKFDRQLIQYISYYDQPWYIDIWSLGIMVLQLVAAEPITIQKLSNSQRCIQQSHSQSYLQIQTSDRDKQKVKQRCRRLADIQVGNFNQITLKDILEAQRSLLYQVESQIQKLSFDKKLHNLVIRMLSINPLTRPSPQQIIRDL